MLSGMESVKQSSWWVGEDLSWEGFVEQVCFKSGMEKRSLCIRLCIDSRAFTSMVKLAVCVRQC